MTLSVLLVPGRQHRSAGHAQCLVVGEGERHRHAAPGRAALAGEVPAVRSGREVLEPSSGLVHVRVHLEQDVLFVLLVLPFTTGHGVHLRGSLDRVPSPEG